MGRTVYWMNTSIDLRIEHNSGEQGGGTWMRIGEKLHREFNARARGLKLMIQGRIIHETMETFWPTAATDESLPDYLREYGEIWMQTPKVLVSRTRTEASYNTRIVGGDNAIEQLAALRAETDGLIGVGGATLATALLRHNLLDEFMLFVHPVVLGTGRPLFDNVLSPIDCDLVEHKTFEHGVTLQRYAIRHPISTARLELRLETTEAVLARIEAMSADDRAQVSAEWLERMRTSVPSPWSHGFEIIDKSTGEAVGSCAFKGPAGPDGAVEIAYQIHPDHRGRGYAKEAARALTDFAFSEGIRLVRAHTLATDGASARVLTAAGFDSIGEVIDPEDGTVWRWERAVRAPH